MLVVECRAMDKDMGIKKFIRHPLVIYLLKFAVVFCAAYFGTIAVEGLAMPGNHYSPFIQNYLDYPSWLRAFLLNGSKLQLSIFGYNTVITDPYHLQMVGGSSVQLIYECLGIGVMSFWLAFVVANKGGWLRKSLWVLGGLLCIWLINVSRISLVLVGNNSGKNLTWGMDNHDFFNVLSYVALFGMIFLYDRVERKKLVIKN